MLKRFSVFYILLSLAGQIQAASANVRLNSIGFVPARQKRATVLTAAGANAFNVRRVADSSSAFSGTLSGAATNADTGESYRIANFDALTEVGNFYLDVTGVGSSVNFRVADDVFNNSMIVNMKGFYGQRCGQAVSFTHNGDTFSYAACHVNDGNLLYWSGSNTVQNGTGGWHDAGDYNKYIVNSGITMGMLLQAWLRHSAALSTLTLAHLPLAERSNAIPDYLDEAKVNLAWMLKQLFADGRVSHKLTTTGFGGFILPNTETATRYFVPWGTEAQGSFVGALALAARVYQPYDAAFATQCQNAALTAYGRLTSSAYVAANQSCCSTGGYSDGNDADVRVWAAAEVWETTGLASALTDVETRLNATANKCDVDWDWANQRNLGTYTYALSTRPGKAAATNTDARNDIVTAANTLVGNRNSHGYGRALTNYYWGVMGAVARTSMNLDVANLISPNAAFLDTAHDQLGHLYGRNYFNRSQVTGEGINPPLQPHHRPSGADGVANPWPGHLIGGGWPSATEWTDVEANYEENEIAINWTGAMTYLLAMFAQPWGAVGTPTFTPTRTRTPTATATRTATLTFTPSRTSTPSPTSTPSATSSPTPSRTATPSRTGTPTASLSPSASATRTASFSPSPSATASRTVSVSPTRSASPTLTRTPTSSASPSPSASASVSPSSSATRTPTPTRSSTASATATRSASPSPSASASVSPSSSATRTPTPTRSGTASATATRSASPSPSASRTGTPSASPSATPSGTPSATPTLSLTRSATPSVSQTSTNVPPGSTDTFTPTISATSTASFTPTASPTGTSSATATGSPSFTPTPSLTPSATLSATPTRTASASPSATPSATATASSSPSATRTGTSTTTSTATNSSTATATSSQSSSATVSQTFTPVPPGSTDTDTPTASATSTLSGTATASATPTGSGTPTGTVTASASPSPTPSVSASGTGSPSVSPTWSPSPIATATPTFGAPPPPSLLALSLTQGPLTGGTLLIISGAGFQPGAMLWLGGVSMTAVSYIDASTLQASTPPGSLGLRELSVRNPDLQSAVLPAAFEYKAPSPTATPAGDPEIRAFHAAPNPSQGPHLDLAVNLSAPADGLIVRIYSPAFTCVAARRVDAPLPAGWGRLRLPDHGLAAGLVYVRLQPWKNGAAGKASAVGKVLISR